MTFDRAKRDCISRGRESTADPNLSPRDPTPGRCRATLICASPGVEPTPSAPNDGTLVFNRVWWQPLLVNDDALYRRYRRLIVKPSLRKKAPQKAFTRSYLFCVALAAISFACSLHFVRQTGAPWWVSAIGMAEGCILILFAPRWPASAHEPKALAPKAAEWFFVLPWR